MKTYGGVEVYLHYSWSWHSTELSGRFHTAANLPPIPTGQEAGRAPHSVWTLRRREKSSASAGNRTPAVAIATGISRLLFYSWSNFKLNFNCSSWLGFFPLDFEKFHIWLYLLNLFLILTFTPKCIRINFWIWLNWFLNLSLNFKIQLTNLYLILLLFFLK
jgi:hypothetical protein